ncbi:MMPL family transporter [Paenibacillus sp. TRM 82003]|uniref:MMPL family transporter n=1 Tax=Kineococcus sp. TRM81007 TaxID=2925831 RepID=UPI001F5788EB|nr:MMPL family transporter [Kineococcus sp. TRM81007]MCI2237278.1 MMPL family transporter [Kineococcus sp. TRM81007]MCI3919337.1 MMPL family transporter [Paenibacillus sp. TRM 82003]
MATLLHRLGRFSARRRRLVLSVWALLLAVIAALAVGLERTAAEDTGFSIPGTQASEGLDVISEEFSGAGADAATATVVLQAPDGQTLTGENAPALQELLERLRGIDGVVSVTDPLAPESPRVSADQTIAAATVTFDGAVGEVGEATTEAFEDATDDDLDAAGGQVRVEVTSQLFTGEPVGHTSEAIGVAVALVVLVLTYGSLVAAGANLLTAAVGVGVGVLGITALSKVVSLSSTTPALASMLGLAVGIDYALFVFARTRSELRRGATVEQAVAKATGTAGTAVVFAGTTVVIALVGLAVVDIPFLTEMGVAAAATVAVAVLIALTAVPALLAVMGRKVLPKKERGLDPAALAAHAAAHAHDDETAAEEALAGPGPLGRWARGVTRHPVIALLAAVVAVGTVAIPVASMRTALPSAENQDPASSARQAYDLLVQGFGEGSQATLLVVVDGEDGASAETVAAAAGTVAQEVQGLDDVVAVLPPAPSADGTAQLITVVPGSGPTDEATSDLVRAIRDATGDVDGARVLVTGQTALDIDVTDALNDALPVYIAVIVVLALVLLVMLFRSIAVPLMATAGFLLSLGASLGSVVAIYQWGWLADVFQVAQPAPLLSFMPVLVVGILFGLAMDYQMFLVSAIHEAHAHGQSPKRAVLAGFRQSAPVVVAAALIMSGVFVGFATSGDAIIGSIGTALTVGVLADALVVRMVIMPAALTLLGERAWWMPRWMERVVPDVDAEGRGLEAALAEEGARGAEPPAQEPVQEPAEAPAAVVPRPRPERAAPVDGTGLAVRGTLTGAGGRALPGAAVTLTDQVGREVARATTGEDGRYHLPVDVGGTYLLIAAAPAAKPAAALVAVADAPVERDVQLAGTASLTGWVRAASRGDLAQPVSGAVLTLVDVRGEVVATTRSEEGGFYRLLDLPGGDYVLSVLADEQRPVAQNVQLPGGAALTHEVLLTAGARLTGTVLTGDGLPVPEIALTLTDAAGGVVGGTTTDADGGFCFEDLATGRYTLTATGYAPIATGVEVVEGRASVVDVQLGTPVP